MSEREVFDQIQGRLEFLKNSLRAPFIAKAAASVATAGIADIAYQELKYIIPPRRPGPDIYKEKNAVSWRFEKEDEEFGIVMMPGGYHGVLDLFALDENSIWRQYNNLVIHATAKPKRFLYHTRSTEIEGSLIQTRLVHKTDTEQVMEYQYTPLSNKAHFFLRAHREKGKREIVVNIHKNSDSSPISAIALGNCFGVNTPILYADTGKIIKASDFDPPKTTHWSDDKWEQIFPPHNTVAIGGDTRLRQYCTVGSNSLVWRIGLRDVPYSPDQPFYGFNYFESLESIVFDEANIAQSVWRFGHMFVP